MKNAIALLILLALAFVCVSSASAHEFKSTEPDHPLEATAAILWSVGDSLHHLVVVPILKVYSAIETESAEKETEAVEKIPRKPKYNFGPRKKATPVATEENL